MDMKKFILLFILTVSVSSVSFAKKNINAWKNEKNLNNQFSVFKKNLNFWDGNFFLKEVQLNQFYNAMYDSITVLRNELTESKSQILSLQNELKAKTEETKEIQENLKGAIKRENSITVFGMSINKTAYSLFMYLFILGVLVLSGIVFLLYKRSLAITRYTKNEYKELKEEFEVHKKNSLDRYTKMNMELHKTRMALNKKK